MDVKTFRAASLPEALRLVERELGPDAAVLQTREVRRGWLGWGGKEVEVTASNDVRVERRLAPEPARASSADPPPLLPDYRQRFQRAARGADSAPSVVAELCGESTRGAFPASTPRELAPSRAFGEQQSIEPSASTPTRSAPTLSAPTAPANPAAGRPVATRAARSETSRATPVMFELLTELLDLEFPEETARDLLERAQASVSHDDLADGLVWRARIARLIEQSLQTTGPIHVTPGQRRVVALVGPTGVGKTTTIAKLAANYRLLEHRRVGLITVDTYRIAAVEQLRTYADIIDLPMEVVATPREMRQAVARLSDLDLVLIDTAGRSPSDEVRVQELRAFLEESQADEVHLVLSSGASVRQLARNEQAFRATGATALLLTKLDETPALGGLFPWLRDCELPVSYLTNGQNVPQDIEPADRRKFARRLLGYA